MSFEQKIICLTGQMAAGKNAVASILEKNGFACIDFDVLVHTAIKECTEQIVQAFAKDAEKRKIVLLDKNSSINRRALGALIFGNKELLLRQESIVYPKVIDLAHAFVKEHSCQTIVYNATVLYKVPTLMNECDAIFFVTAPFFTRLLRAKKRDSMPLKNILARFKSQKNLFSDYKKTGIPIKKINNKKSFTFLEKKVLIAINSLKIL